MPSLSRTLEQALHRAIKLASDRHHEYATLEHLLLALIDDPDAQQVMKACNANIDGLRKSLQKYIDEELITLVIEDGEDAKPTTGFQRVMSRAMMHVQNSGRDEVTGANVLVALFTERESHAVYFLQEQNMSRLDAVSFISLGIAKRPGMSQQKSVRGADEEEEGEKSNKQGTEALEAYCVNLNEKAKNGKIDPLIGREMEVERTIQILCRRQKNNPLFVG
ncbi:MAG TPA: Clp protease N-terminal domain-containing protein, partial [Rhizomicrobium sp.]|nr:Clp protease N-terminal domain-containing protein [Rhizomicrobium sp.]